MRKHWQSVAIYLLSLSILITLSLGGCKKAGKNSVSDQEQARSLVLATMEYAEKHDGTYPDAKQWEEQLRPFLPKDFHFTLDSNPNHRFAMNSVFSQKKMETLSSDFDQAVLYFESTTSTPSAHDELTSLPRSGQTIVLAFRLGHVYAHPVEWRRLLEDPLQRRRFVGK